MSKNNLDYVSILSKDSVISDDKIVVPFDFKISGTIRMNIESTGKVVITESGVVEGYIRANEVQINGRVTGEVISLNKLVINGNAVVEGRIATDTLMINDGAQCNAEMAVGKEAIERRKSEIIKSTGKENKPDNKEDNSPQGSNKSSKTGNTSQGGKVQGNGQDIRSKTEITPVNDDKTAGGDGKKKEDKASNKNWIDRFW